MKKIFGLILFLMFANISIVHADTVMVQVRFRVETSHGQYNDALYFTQAEYASIPKATIDSMKQERVDNWIYSLENLPPYIEPTLEELQSMKVELMLRVDELNIKITAKTIEVIE